MGIKGADPLPAGVGVNDDPDRRHSSRSKLALPPFCFSCLVSEMSSSSLVLHYLNASRAIRILWLLVRAPKHLQNAC